MPQENYHGNGCAFPPSRYQCTSWLTGAALSGVFYGLVLPNLPEQIYIAFGTGFSLAAAVTIVCCYVCTIIDPSDPGLKNKRNPVKFPLVMTMDEFPNVCIKCRVRVKSKSKHCRACDRCTADFDHHCFWMNNCVARPNYTWFVVMITAVELAMALETYSASYVLASILTDRLQDNPLMRKYDIRDRGYCFLTLLTAVALVSLFFVVTNGFLLLFHCYLRIRRISTFEYLMLKRQSRSKVHPMKYSQTAGTAQQVTMNETIHPQGNGSPRTSECKRRSARAVFPNVEESAMEDSVAEESKVAEGKEDPSEIQEQDNGKEDEC